MESPGFQLFTHICILQIFIEYLLRAKPCSRHLDTTVNKAGQVPILVDLVFSWGETDHNS